MSEKLKEMHLVFDALLWKARNELDKEELIQFYKFIESVVYAFEELNKVQWPKR